MIMNLKITFLAVVSSLLLASCGTSSVDSSDVDSKRCISHTQESPSNLVEFTFNYFDSKPGNFKAIVTNKNTGNIDSVLYQIQYINNLVQSIHSESYNSSVFLTWTKNSVFEYNSEGRVKSEIRYYFSYNNTPTDTQNLSYVWSNNNLTVEMVPDTSIILTKTYDFNSFGQIVEKTLGTTSTQYFYDDKNSPFKNIIFPLRIAYQSDGLPPFSDKINNINGYGGSNVQYNYTYDDDDFPTSLDIINEDGTIYNNYTWTYD